MGCLIRTDDELHDGGTLRREKVYQGGRVQPASQLGGNCVRIPKASMEKKPEKRLFSRLSWSCLPYFATVVTGKKTSKERIRCHSYESRNFLHLHRYALARPDREQKPHIKSVYFVKGR